MHAFIFACCTARVLKTRLADAVINQPQVSGRVVLASAGKRLHGAPLRPELSHLVSVLCKNFTHRHYSRSLVFFR